MFFVDEPYLSDFLKTTLKENAIPVVDTDAAKKLGLFPGTNLVSEARAVELAQALGGDLAVYTTSENAIGWIAQQFSFSDLPSKIELFKNKVKFRELTHPIFPHFYFKEVPTEMLKSLAIKDLPLPFIIKPTAGFFSMGVYKVSSYEEWDATLDAILAEIEQTRGSYPAEVLNIDSFIIEECIKGDEFALDAYFNAMGKPVILNILHHAFSSASDVGDRVYTTSKEIIESNLAEFTEFVGDLGRLAGVRNFPVHIELRRTSDGTMLPIEVNPMRFGGWCTTPDLCFLAYGFNPYLYYYRQQEPDWGELLKSKEDKLFSLIILDNSTGVAADAITSFDYAKLISHFEKLLEFRRMDHHKYPVFGFLFTETRAENRIELDFILRSDLNEFITTEL